MCWNADISLNTFIFSIFSLMFIYISNTYTRYKTEGFDGFYHYFLFILFVFVQLFEYFIWKNLKSKRMNYILSILLCILIFSQMFFLIFIAKSIYQPYLLAYYFIFIATFFLYKTYYNPIQFKTTVSPNGHLSWEFFRMTGYEKIFLFVGFSFYILPLFLSNLKYTSLYLLLITFILTYMLFKKDNTYGSLWCWVFNLIFILYIVNILIISPFYEYNRLC